MRSRICGLWSFQVWSTYPYAENRQHYLIYITREINVTGRLKSITWISFRYLDNLAGINYGETFEKFFCEIFTALKLHLKVLFNTLESLSNPMIFITNYLMNAIASILQKNLFFICGRNIKYHLNLIQALDPIWQWYLLNKVTIITNCILLLVKILVTILTFFENLMIFWKFYNSASSIFIFF